MSFIPSHQTAWGIYKDAPPAYWDTNSYFDETAVPNDWEDTAGVYVEIWRFNTIDFNQQEPFFAEWSDLSPEYGFGERIHQSEISLPSAFSQEENPAYRWLSGVPVDGSNVYGGKELFKKLSVTLSFPEDSAARVDRRHYAYALVIRFYGGPRRVTSGLSLPQLMSGSRSLSGTDERAYDDERWYRLRRQPILSEITDRADVIAFDTLKRAPLGLLAVQDVGPYVETAGLNWAGYRQSSIFGNLAIPKVKFRGARIGWVTDKAGDKGWG